MGTLTGCMKKAGNALPEEDRQALEARFLALTQDGIKAKAAAQQAVDERIEEVRARMRDLGETVDEPQQPAEEPNAAPEAEQTEPDPPTNRAIAEPETKPETLIELRKRQSVLRQLLDCLG